jgi:hypothetical protein
MTRYELIELGYKIKNFTGSEEDHVFLLNQFSNNVPHPDGAALFYYPENYNSKDYDISKYDPTVEEVVDKALSYKPIQL